MNKNTTTYSTSDEEVIRSTREEVFRNCMTLEESKRKILEKINRHFHKA